MNQSTKQKILLAATKIFALDGYIGLSMRKLAQQTGVASSVLYHHYQNKDEILRKMYEFLSNDLGLKRTKLKTANTAREMLRERIFFQLNHMEAVVAILKYYLTFR